MAKEEIVKKVRWFYKDKVSGKAAYSLKEPLSNILSKEKLENFVEIDEAEWNELTAVPAPAPLTEEQIAVNEKKARISQLKALLKETDYQAIKFAEGWITAEDYAEMKALRQSYRDEINQLEAELA